MFLGHGRSRVWAGQQSASHSLRFAHSLSLLLLLSVAKAFPALNLNTPIKAERDGSVVMRQPLNSYGFLPLPVIAALFLGGGLVPVLMLPLPFSTTAPPERNRRAGAGLQQMPLQVGLTWNCFFPGQFTHLSWFGNTTTRFPKLFRNLSSHSWEVIQVWTSEEEMGINPCRGPALSYTFTSLISFIWRGDSPARTGHSRSPAPSHLTGRKAAKRDG